MSKLDELLDRRDQLYDGEATLTNEELSALIAAVRAADALVGPDDGMPYGRSDEEIAYRKARKEIEG